MECDKADNPAEAKPPACRAEVRAAKCSISVYELLTAREMAYHFHHSIGRIGSQYRCLMKDRAHELMTLERFRSMYGHFACRVYCDTRKKKDVRRLIDYAQTWSGTSTTIGTKAYQTGPCLQG